MIVVEKQPSVKALARASVARDIISLNKSNNRHWSSKTRPGFQKGIWFSILGGHLGLAKRHEGKKRMICFTRPYGGRVKQMDQDNFIGGCKPVLDALVKLGWIKDDSPQFVECIYNQIKFPDAKTWPKEKGTVLRVRLMVGIYEMGAQNA